MLGAIGLSCTDSAGVWSGNTFDDVFLPLLASSNGTYRTVRLVAEKSVHITLFAGLAATLWNSLGSARLRRTYTVIAGFALGCSSELFQRLFPTRDPSIRDVLINWSGVILGVAISHIVHVFFRSSNRRASSIDAEFAAADMTSADLLALASHVRSYAPDHRPQSEEDTSADEVAVASQAHSRA
jgi:VanZ family protein